MITRQADRYSQLESDVATGKVAARVPGGGTPVGDEPRRHAGAAR
jgi:hypothetical protein